MLRDIFICSVSFLYAKYHFYMLSIICIRYVSFLYATYHFYMLRIIFIWYVSFLYATYHFYICTVNFPPFEQHVWEVSPESGSVLTKCTDPDTTQKFSMCRNKFSFWKGCKIFLLFFVNSFNNTNFFIFLFLNFDNKHFVIRICLRYFLQQKLCEFTYIYCTMH